MRKTLKTVLSGLFGLLLMAGCMNVFDPPVNDGGDAGSGTVILTLAGTGENARTILPAAPVFSAYKVVFSRIGVADISYDEEASALSSSKAFKLPEGEWTVTVTGYQTIAGEQDARAAASGSAPVTAASGTQTAVTVELKPLTTGGKGIFQYTITLPQSPAVVTGAALSIKAGNTEKLGVDLTSAASDSRELDPGCYDLFLTLTDGEGTYGQYHVVYIYAGLVTEFGTEGSPVDLSGLLFASKAPTIGSVNTVNKTGVSQSPVTFTLTSTHTGTWALYSAVSGGEALTDISLSFATETSVLTLSASGGVPAGDYWVSVTETGKAESLRLKLTLTDPVSSAPTAAVTEVTKVNVGDTSADFTLTSNHDAESVWQVYTVATEGTPLADVTASLSGSILTLASTSSTALVARVYYVAVAEPDMAESTGRLALTVKEGALPTLVTFAVNTDGNAFIGTNDQGGTIGTTATGTLTYPDINGLKVVNIGSGTINLGSWAGGYFGEEAWTMELYMKIPSLSSKFEPLVFHTDTGKNTAGTMRIESPAGGGNWIFFAYTGSTTPAGSRRISFASPTVNIWRHMVFIKTAADTVTVYLDGVQATEFTGFTEFTNPAFENITTALLGGVNNTQIYKYVIRKEALDPAGEDAGLFAQAKADINTLNTTGYVTFDPNGGAWGEDTDPIVTPVIRPATTAVLPEAPEKDGHAFIGWNTANDGTGSEFIAATAVSADITVYANWVDVNSSYNVVFNANGGAWDGSYTNAGTLGNGNTTLTVTKYFSAGSTLDTNMPDNAKVTRTNYVLDSWNTSADGSGSAFDGTTAVTSETTTVYAVWKVDNPAAFLKLRHDFNPARFSGGMFIPVTGNSDTTKATPVNTGWSRGSGTANEKTFYYFQTGEKKAMNAGATYLNLGTGAGAILHNEAPDGYTMSAYVYIGGDTSGNGNMIWAFADTNNVGSNAGKAIWFSVPSKSHTTSTGGYGGNAKSIVSPDAITLNTWHHVAYTQKGTTGTSNAKLYVDGVLKISGPIPALPKNFGTIVHNALGGPCFQADNNLSQTKFTDFRIYNEVLEAEQIAALAGDLEDLSAVETWTPIADSATPATDTAVVFKASATQAAVSFTLTSSNDGTWRVYDAQTEGSEVSGVTAVFSSDTLTLTASDGNLEEGFYYVSVAESGKAESARLALRVREPLPADGLIFELNFDVDPEGSTTASTGRVTANGTISYEEGVSGKAGVFNGTAANYLAVTGGDGESLLAGLAEFSVSFWVKQSNVNSWWLYAAPNTNAQPNNPTYIGALFQKSNSNRFLIERYLNGRSNSFNTANNSVPTDGAWKHVVLVFTAVDYTAYIDGVQAGTSSTSIQPITGILGTTPILYIGRANWGSGEGATGSIDEYKIYSKALTPQEVEALYDEEAPEDPEVALNFSGIPANAVSMALSSSVVSKAAGTTITATVNNAENYTKFEWRLDDVKQAETGGSYDIAVSSLALGQHQVMVTAWLETVPYSDRAAFTVTG
jgi:uncharacterized repeat protein (TIGR02543 family)